MKRITALCAIALLAGCQGDSSGPDQGPSEVGVARLVGPAISQGLLVMSRAELAFSGAWASGVSADPQLGSCSFSPSAVQWTCTMTDGGASGEVRVQDPAHFPGGGD